MHFHLWGRGALAARSDGYFDRVRPIARWHTAERQGFAGVRWPKMVGPPELMTFEDGTRWYTGPSGAGSVRDPTGAPPGLPRTEYQA